MGGYVLAVIAFVPGLLLTLGGGLLFGVAAGTLYVFVAATLGACCAFLIARYVARGPVERRLEGNERFAAIDHAIGREGRKITFLLRLSPVFPFNLLNYALGLTRVRLVDYAVASIGMLPATIVYVYVGSLLGDIAQLGTGAAASNEDTALLRQGLSVVGLAATIAVTVVITRTARRALAQATEEGVFVQERERA
jgi:uncharacterized membrane protein YdjX (TVP38/TMEM64 family)